MGLNISELAANTATVTVPFMGQSCEVTYKPSVLTTERVEKIDSGNGDGINVFIADLVTDWDILLSPKKKVPLTVDGVKQVPLPLLKAIFQRIMQEASQGEADGPSSAG